MLYIKFQLSKVIVMVALAQLMKFQKMNKNQLHGFGAQANDLLLN